MAPQPVQRARRPARSAHVGTNTSSATLIGRGQGGGGQRGVAARGDGQPRASARRRAPSSSAALQVQQDRHQVPGLVAPGHVARSRPSPSTPPSRGEPEVVATARPPGRRRDREPGRRRRPRPARRAGGPARARSSTVIPLAARTPARPARRRTRRAGSGRRRTATAPGRRTMSQDVVSIVASWRSGSATGMGVADVDLGAADPRTGSRLDTVGRRPLTRRPPPRR